MPVLLSAASLGIMAAADMDHIRLLGISGTLCGNHADGEAIWSNPTEGVPSGVHQVSGKGGRDMCGGVTEGGGCGWHSSLEGHRTNSPTTSAPTLTLTHPVTHTTSLPQLLHTGQSMH